jgi:uncharacterized protein GlcG (DUF336 family)
MDLAAVEAGEEDVMRRMHLVVGVGVLAMALVIQIASAAEELPKEPVLPITVATKAAAGAFDKCREDGYRVSVAVVDRSGVLMAFMRASGAGPHTVSSSTKKAYTAASLRRPTGELAEMIAKQPAAQGLRDMDPNILMLGGGLPIEIGGDVIGGIGVGGAPGAQLDEACARAGLDSIAANLKTPSGK